MLDRRLPLNALRAFEAVARQGSVASAARELHVSVGAVSRHIAILEAHFGCELLLRQRTGVQLTQRGLAYYNKLSRAFEIIMGAGSEIGKGDCENRLHVHLYTTFASEWLSPRLAAFREAYPAINLRMTISTQEANFDRDLVDIAITGLPVEDPRLHYDPLFEMRLLPVCAPQIMDGPTPLIKPADVRRCLLLYEGREAFFWNKWFEAFGEPPIDLASGLRFDTVSPVYQAARRGAGVALAQLFFVIDDLRAGGLVAPFRTTLRTEFPHRLVIRKSRLEEPMIVAFRNWIIGEVRKTNEAMEQLAFHDV